MITIIAKKIDARLSTGEANYERMDALVRYCANPQSKIATEKCIAVQAINFSDDHPSMDRVIDEMTFDMMKGRRQDVELVSHWVISWKGGEPSIDKIFDSARHLLEDLGYTEANRAVLAVHADTGHLHVHVAVCKVDMWTGKVNPESWYKNEAQKLLARIADKFGWGLEPGARYRVKPDARKETVKVRTTQGVREYARRAVTKNERRRPGIAAGAKKYEHRTGLKSAQRQLQERLVNFLESNRAEMPSWKFGNLHRELAYFGIECKRVQHKAQFYASFSLDGKNFFAASKVCPELSYDNLRLLLGGRSWRDSRPDLDAVRAEARERHAREMEFVSQAPFDSVELKRLARIPVDEVWKALGKAPKGGEADAFSALSSAGFSAPDAARWLAEKFPNPDRKRDNPGNEILNKILSSGVAIDPDHLPRARRIAEFMGAMHADRLRIFTSEITREMIENAQGKGVDLHEISSKPMRLDQVCKLLPHIQKLESCGIELSCRPAYDDARPVVIASDHDTHYAAPAEFPLPGCRRHDLMTLTVLAHGAKSMVRTEIDGSALDPIPAGSIDAYLSAKRDAVSIQASGKFAYTPHEPEREALSDELLKLFERQQKELLDRMLDDRQRAWALADELYRAGANPNQVYTALGATGEARDAAMRQMPLSFTGSTSEWQRKRASGKAVSSLDPVDFSMDAQAPDARPAKSIRHVQKERKDERQ